MKKLFALLVVLCLVVGLFAGCAGGDNDSTTSPSADTNTDDGDTTSPGLDDEDAEGAQVALIVSALSNIDDRGFFQSTWEGIQEFCDANGYTCQWYQPSENTEDAVYEIIDLAVLNGAEVICSTGGDFIGMMENIFAAYPDLYFICNETPYTTPAENSIIYIFQAQESGFLAGAALVYEGFTSIGMVGGVAILPVMRAGYGFIQGVNWAAGELGIDGIELRYWYSNSLEASPDTQTYAASWYQSGVEVIAAFCGGGAVSVFAAAEANDGIVVGTDVDQSGESETVISSVLKNVKQSTMDGLQLWHDGEFAELGGQLLEMDAAANGVGLEMENARFENFTQEQYDEIYNMIVNDEIDIITVEDVAEDATPNDIFDMLDEQNITFQFFE